MRHGAPIRSGLLAAFAVLTLLAAPLRASEVDQSNTPAPIIKPLPTKKAPRKAYANTHAPLPVLSLANFSQTGTVAKPPIGWTQFCATLPEECESPAEVLTIHQDAVPEPRIVTLTQDSWATLNRINSLINDTIEQVSDLDHYGVLEWWAFPDDGKGDCEDLQLLKRRLLMSAGFPRQTLLMTVVRDKQGEGHAVLMVRTDRGDLVLDSRISTIKVWQKTDYKYIKRQSQDDQNLWVYFGDGSDSLTTASAAK